MTNIAINGFGRIGRLFFREAVKKEGFNIVAINDLGDIEQLAYLLRYDTVYGRFSEKVQVKKNSIVVGGKNIAIFSEKDPLKLPWKKLKVDVAVEATGAFSSFVKARVHIKAGAKRVVITAPARDAETKDAKTVLMGVNEEDLASCVVSSNGSCTTNATAVILQILENELGVKKAVLNAVHGYTATQNLVDGSTRGKDIRRGRAAAQNIIPSSTGAAHAVTRVVRSLQGKFDGVAIRVPVIAGSLADITLVTAKPTTKKEVNDILTTAASSPQFKDVLSVTTDPIVSSDIIGEPYGAIVDLNFTRVVDGDLVKILAWYDNEAGYVATLLSHVAATAKTIK